MKRVLLSFAAVFCLVAFLSIIFFFDDGTDEMPTIQERLLTQLLSRVGVVHVDVYKDTNMMNGPISYHFQMDDTQNLIQRLKVVARNSLPGMFDVLIRHIRADTKWNFNWESAKVYSATYCLKGDVVLFDLLLVDNHDVIYITDTYIERDSSVVGKLCDVEL